MKYNPYNMTKDENCTRWEPNMVLSRLYGVSRCSPTPRNIRQSAEKRAIWKEVNDE